MLTWRFHHVDCTQEEHLHNHNVRHPLLPPCDCHWECRRLVRQARRDILSEFWSILSFDYRKKWIHSNIQKEQGHNKVYFFRGLEGEHIQMYRICWLATFAYTPNRFQATDPITEDSMPKAQGIWSQSWLWSTSTETTVRNTLLLWCLL